MIVSREGEAPVLHGASCVSGTKSRRTTAIGLSARGASVSQDGGPSVGIYAALFVVA